MSAGTFVTTGHTSGSAGAGMTACAVADGAARLPALMVVNAPLRNARRLIMPDLYTSATTPAGSPHEAVTKETARSASIERFRALLESSPPVRWRKAVCSDSAHRYRVA